jgi:hypothetical protein
MQIRPEKYDALLAGMYEICSLQISTPASRVEVQLLTAALEAAGFNILAASSIICIFRNATLCSHETLDLKNSVDRAHIRQRV